MEDGQAERAQGCWRCYKWFPGRTPRANPEEHADDGMEEVPLGDPENPQQILEHAAQHVDGGMQEVPLGDPVNPPQIDEPEQPINREEAENVENPRQREVAESVREDCCCPCFFPCSTPQQEIAPPAQDAAVVEGHQEGVPVAAVHIEPTGGSQQPLNLTDEGILEEEMEPACETCPPENYKPFLVLIFVLLFLLCTGQAFNIMSYAFGWRDGTDKEHTSTETDSSTTTESNMIFDITTAITM